MSQANLTSGRLFAKYTHNKARSKFANFSRDATLKFTQDRRKSRRRNASSKFTNHKKIDEKIIKAFYRFDLRNGKKDVNGKIRNRLYLTWLDASGAQLNRYVIDEADEKYKRKIPDDPSTKLKISFVVRKNERWVLLEVYSKEHRDAPAFTAERCLWSGLEKELLEDFDAGEALKL